jgi:hypothetical protein
MASRLSRKALITGAFLTVTGTAVGLEVWFATDSDPDTRPWTDLVASYIPAPITFAAIAILVAWLPAHFVEAYASRRRANMDTTTIPATPQVGAPKEPLVGPASITAAAGAILSVLVAFGLDLTPTQTGAVLAAVPVVTSVALLLLARPKVYSPATVRDMVVDAADNLHPGETRTVAAEVTAESPAAP